MGSASAPPDSPRIRIFVVQEFLELCGQNSCTAKIAFDLEGAV